MCADNTALNKSYKAQMLLVHPDRNPMGVDTSAKTKMLNEAKTLLLIKEKRKQFESKWLSDLSATAIEKDDIVKLQLLNTKKYNYTYGRVVSENLAEQSFMRRTYDIQILHLHSHYDSGNSATKDEIIRLKWYSWECERTVSRVYAEPERLLTATQWSTYYARDDRVTIKNVVEAPWYNDMEACIKGYNRDLMRFDVWVGGALRSFMPHNLVLSQEHLADVRCHEQRVESEVRWSTYYAKDDRVTIKNSRYNDADATIVQYDSWSMCFEVLLAGELLAFMPHHIRRASTLAPAEALPSPPEVQEAEECVMPAVMEYSVSEVVEVRWQNAGADLVGKARKVTWHVAVVIVLNFHEDVVSSYDVRMPDTFSKQPGAIMREVSSKHLQKRRKRGKRASPEAKV